MEETSKNNETAQLGIGAVMQRFIDVVQKDKKVFIGHLDVENYIEIQYLLRELGTIV
jgi:hypothetical protein